MNNRLRPAALLAALLLCAAGQASAQTKARSVSIRVIKDKYQYNHTVLVEEGKQSTFRGKVTDQELTFATFLTRSGEGHNLQYQFAISGGKAAIGRSLEGQGDIDLPTGQPGMTMLNCGPWQVSLAVDSRQHTNDPKAWQEGGPFNARLSTILITEPKSYECALVNKIGSQANVTDAISEGDRRAYSFTYRLDNDNKLQFDLEQGLFSRTKPVTGSKIIQLAPGKLNRASGPGYKLDLSLQTVPARKPGAKKKEKISADGYGTIPIIQ